MRALGICKQSHTSAYHPTDARFVLFRHTYTDPRRILRSGFHNVGGLACNATHQRHPRSQIEHTSPTITPGQPPRPITSSSYDRWLAAVASTVLHGMLLAPAAFADNVEYNPGGGADTVKAFAGVGYIILVIIYFARLFKKRANRATTERLASTAAGQNDDDDGDEDDGDEDDDSDSEDEDAVVDEKEATPIACFIGSAQAGVICYLLFLGTTAVDGYFAKQPMPDQYTAHNIAVLVQTVVRGLTYLLTFIFGMNSLGLGGLGIQLIFFPDSLNEDGSRRTMLQRDILPKVSVTDDFGSIKRAFEQAEQMGKKKSAAEQQKDSKK